MIDILNEHLKDAENAINEARNLIEDAVPELTTIPHSTIEWDAERANINFKDREVMETLTKCYGAMVNPQDIINDLNELA